MPQPCSFLHKTAHSRRFVLGLLASSGWLGATGTLEAASAAGWKPPSYRKPQIPFPNRCQSFSVVQILVSGVPRTAAHAPDPGLGCWFFVSASDPDPQKGFYTSTDEEEEHEGKLHHITITGF